MSLTPSSNASGSGNVFADIGLPNPEERRAAYEIAVVH